LSDENDGVIDPIPPDDILEYYTGSSELLKRSVSYLLQSSGEAVVVLAPGEHIEQTMAAISGSPSELGQLFTIGFDMLAYNFGIHWPKEFIASYVSTMPESTQRAVLKRIREVTGVED
jgi:hypothetical protein